MTLADELWKLEQLRSSGAIDEAEFAAAKARLLREAPADASSRNHAYHSVDDDFVQQDQEIRLWGMLLHLSVLLGFAVPIAGLVAPIIIWQWKKVGSPEIDQHGKNAVNWIISELIYLAVSLVLVVALIGIPMLMALGVLGIVFPIIAGIKANNGEVWRYPLSIQFLK